MGWLNWKDLVLAADIWKQDLHLTAAEKQRCKALLDSVASIKSLILAEISSSALLVTVIQSNGIEPASLRKLQLQSLAQIVADGVLRGRLPPCPLCETRGLVGAGFAVYCFGWIDNTTKCNFYYHLLPRRTSTSDILNSRSTRRTISNQENENDNENENKNENNNEAEAEADFCPEGLVKIVPPSSYEKRVSQMVATALQKRQQNFLIPAHLATQPLWRKVSAAVLKLSQMHPALNFKTKAYAGDGSKAEAFTGKGGKAKGAIGRGVGRGAETVATDKVGAGQELQGLAVAILGSTSVPRVVWKDRVGSHDGTYVENPAKLADMPLGLRAVVCTDRALWKSTQHGVRAAQALQAGATVLDLSWLEHLLQLAPGNPLNGSQGTGKSGQSQESEKLGGASSQAGLGGAMVGVKLRLKENMAKYHVAGAKAFDVPVPMVAGRGAGSSSSAGDQADSLFESAVTSGSYTHLPAVLVRSQVMGIHPWFLESVGEIGDDRVPNVGRTFAVYVDRGNHVFNAMLTYVSAAEDQNRAYYLQLIEQSVIRASRPERPHPSDDLSALDRSEGTQTRYHSEGNKRKRLAEGSKETTAKSGSDAEDADSDASERLGQNATVIDNTKLSESKFARKEKAKNSRYFFFKKWGRLGNDENVRTNNASTEQFDEDLEGAKTAFLAKFFELSGVNFYARFASKGRPGRYQHVELKGYQWPELEDKPGKSAASADMQSHGRKMGHEGKASNLDLDERVYNLLMTIYSRDLIELCVADMHLDTSQFQIESLSLNQLTTGYTILSELSQLLRRRKSPSAGSIAERGASSEDICRSAMEEERRLVRIRALSDKFYSCIPHACARGELKKMVISSMRILQQKCQLMSDVILTARSARCISDGLTFEKGKGLMSEEESEVRRIKDLMAKMNVKIQPLSTTIPGHRGTGRKGEKDAWNTIQRYLETTHATTHNAFTLKLLNVFRLSPRNDDSQAVNENADRKAEREDGKDAGKCMLLWHGSRSSNWGGILRYGLKVAPPEAPATGYMFGKGVYFTDVVSKAAQYCAASVDNSQAYLLLAEVSLGRPYLRVEADETAARVVKKRGLDSSIGLGQVTAVDIRDLTRCETITAGPPFNQNHSHKHSQNQKQNQSKKYSAYAESLGLNADTLVPIGKLNDCTDSLQRLVKADKSVGKKLDLLYNEYVVYDTQRITPRFLLQVDFRFDVLGNNDSDASHDALESDSSG